jgi:hypothetical protein
MNLRADIELIISKDVEEVVNTPLILTLLRVYSLLYLNGQQPRACGQCQRGYYSEIKTNGLKKYETMENNLNRTCELANTDLIYLSPMQMHISNVNITDEMAARCLDNGWLKPKDFTKLPENYKVKGHPDLIIEDQPITKEPVKIKKAK